MKKILVILMILVCAFNSVGYRLLVSWLENRANTKLEIALDQNDYNSKDAIVLSVPVDLLSYYNSSLEYDRQYGVVEIDGNPYRFVKMRLHADSLEIVCIPDYPARQSITIQDHFVRWNMDTQQTDQNKKSGSHHGTYKIISAEFDAFCRSTLPLIYFRTVSKKLIHFFTHLSSLPGPVIENPPDISC